MSGEWLTEVSQIPTASLESLKMSLITCDGRGEKFKERVLEEIIERVKREVSEKYEDLTDDLK